MVTIGWENFKVQTQLNINVSQLFNFLTIEYLVALLFTTKEQREILLL